MLWKILFDDYELLDWIVHYNLRCLMTKNLPIDKKFKEMIEKRDKEQLYDRT